MKQTKNNFFVLLSCLLVCTLIVAVFPLQSMASDEQPEQTTSASGNEPAQTAPNPDYDPNTDTPTDDPNEAHPPSAGNEGASTFAISGEILPDDEEVIPSGVYSIVNLGNGKAMDVRAGGTTTGTVVQQYTEYTTVNRNQLFKITYLDTVNGANYYSIRSMTNSALGLYTQRPVAGMSITLKDIGTADSYNSIPSNGVWVIKQDGSGVTIGLSGRLPAYIGTGGSTANEQQLTLASTLSNNCRWTLKRYTGNTIEGFGWNDFQHVVFHGDSVTYSAYMYSSVIGKNGPVTYSIRKLDGDVTEYAGINSLTGQLITGSAANIQVGVTCANHPNTLWYDVEICHTVGNCYIQNKESHKVIQADASGNLEQYTLMISNDQFWQIAINHDGYYLIRKTNTVEYLTTPADLLDDIEITLEPFTPSKESQQLWAITPNTNGTYKVQAKIREGTSLVLALGDGTITSNGLSIQQRVSGYVTPRDEWCFLGQKYILIDVPNDLRSSQEHLCIPCAITNIAGYWSRNGYSGFNCYTSAQQEAKAVEVQTAMALQGGSATSNVNIPFGFAIFEYTENSTTYRLSSTNYWQRDNAFTTLDIIEEINQGHPLMLGFAAGADYVGGHMTVCAGYSIEGDDIYVYVSDAWDVESSSDSLLFNKKLLIIPTHNDFICKVIVVSE